MTAIDRGESATRYGRVVDLDSCTGCGACMVACSVENNIPSTPSGSGLSTGLHSIRVYRVAADRGGGNEGVAFFPVMCQHCESHTPCVSVCPQNAVELDPKTGIVAQIPSRCLGCRYCMAACPYHARSFNWWDPEWPEGVEATLNPDVSPRMRGVVEKCNFCHGRLQAAKAEAAADGRREIEPDEYRPACVEACPTGTLVFGDTSDPGSDVSRAARSSGAFRLLERLGTEPKVTYRSKRSWVRKLGERELGQAALDREEEEAHAG